jgi:hypothetical protein
VCGQVPKFQKTNGGVAECTKEAKEPAP